MRRASRQCIHRDLKGENLLITANDRIKMTDFGASRLSDASDRVQLDAC
jgi:serine/threonine protein kinase